jgi:hypothetical protein
MVVFVIQLIISFLQEAAVAKKKWEAEKAAYAKKPKAAAEESEGEEEEAEDSE